MRSPIALFCFLLAPVLAGVDPTSAQDAQPPPRPIRGMRYPALSPDGARIVFSYRGDLWTVSSAGGEATLLAKRPGWDSRPRWSPDGQTIAFNSDVNRDIDVFTIPAAGGEAKQVTFHSTDDILSDWSPDGKSLLFYSARDSRSALLYSIRLADGRLTEYTRDEQTLQAHRLSPDGKWLVYARGRGEWARKGYRGSSNSDLYLLAVDRPGQIPRRLTDFAGHDLWPQFSPDGRWIYFASDRDGVGNLWRMPARGGSASQVTKQRDGYIHYPHIDRRGRLATWETDFSVWTVDLSRKNAVPNRLVITARIADEPRKETRRVANRAEEIEISPDGKTIAVGARNDIFLVPSTGGAARRITDSLAIDRDFNWSVDGQSLVYVSERDANQDLYLYDLPTGQTRRLTTHTEPESSPIFSPDGRELAFIRGNTGGALMVMPARGGPERRAAEGPFLSSPTWSPDGRWVAYSKRTLAAITNVYVAPAQGGREINISRWNGNNSNPLWTPDGKRLLFSSTRSGNPEIFAVDLTRPRPATATATSTDTGSAPASVHVDVDPDRIDRRVRQILTQPAGSKSATAFTHDGKNLLFTVSTGGLTGGERGPRRPGAGPPTGAFAGLTLYQAPLTGGAPTRIAEGLGPIVRLSPDGTTVYTASPVGGSLRKVAITGGTPETINFECSYEVDLAEERRQTFDQAWRLLRDNFYDPNMHGVDWETIRARFRPIVDECIDINDFHLLLTELNGELNASHTGASPSGGGFRGGAPGRDRGDSGTANLGVWFDWSHDGPGLKVSGVLRDGPADDDATRIRPGEYVLEVAGKEVGPNEALFQVLANLGGRATDILVNDKPDKNGARTVKLTPLTRSAFTNALYEHWVQEQRELVRRLSNGRLAYLHIRAMDQASLQRFDRELLTEAYDHDGLVLDVRYNGGGRIHDDLLAILTRRVHAFETPRGALKMTQPFGAFYKPSILLINQNSFSDAEIFPNGYRVNGLGTIVGVPTGGGVIGTNNRILLDGATQFRVPTTGWHTLDGRNLENWGVPPDVYVDYTPEDHLRGQDPQTERAVAELLRQIKQGRRNMTR